MWRLPSFRRLDPVGRTLSGGVIVLLVSYVIVFLITPDGRETFGEALIGALINVVALLFWGALAWWINSRALLDRPLALQAFVHPLLGFAFSVAWYFSVTVLLGWQRGEFSGSFSVVAFSYVAFVWQVFQGLTLYALIVALAILRRWPRDGARSEETQPARLLVRSDDEFVSIPIADIVCIERAGDYAQLTTARSRHLTRKSLAELERQLPADRFIRVHRSHLINLDALEAAEPIGGGRLRARLSGGVQVETSRSGAKALRDRAG